jgi:cytoskeletal protein CcmA (bactofilin family)
MVRVAGSSGAYRRAVAVVLAIVLLLAAVPGVAVAETRAGGSIVVEADETIDSDLEAFGGSITIYGTVDGDVQAFGGTVRIEGTVTGDVSASAGSVVIGREARIGGNLKSAADDVTIAGTVRGTVTVSAETITLTDGAIIGGDVEYDGTLGRDSGAVIRGTVSERSGFGIGSMLGISIPSWIPPVCFFATGLLAAVFLLAVFPDFSAGVARDVTMDPLRAGGAGILALVGVPVAIGLLSVTLIGIPLALAGLGAYLLSLWLGACTVDMRSASSSCHARQSRTAGSHCWLDFWQSQYWYASPSSATRSIRS